MVFLGVRGDGTLFGYTQLVGENVNSESYHRILQHRALPNLRAGNGGDLARLVWQQVIFFSIPHLYVRLLLSHQIFLKKYRTF